MRVAFLLLPALVITLAAGCRGDGQESPVPPMPAPSTPARILIAINESEHVLTVVHVPTGRTVARLTVGGQPWAVFHRPANELLVSDIDPSGGRPRLLVYGLDRSGPPKWSLPLPERASPTAWSQAMALSRDGRFLYYAVRPRDERGRPESGYPRQIGIVDLEAREELDRAELPTGCGYYKTLESAGSESVRVFCPPDGFVTVHPGGWVSAVVNQVDVPVDFGAVPCWSPGSMVSCRLDDGRRIVGEREDGAGHVTSLLLYEDRRDRHAARLRLPGGIVHFAPVDGNTVGLLEEDTGLIHLLDLTSGKVADRMQGPAGAEWLVGS